jgi:hypothetical protein
LGDQNIRALIQTLYHFLFFEGISAWPFKGHEAIEKTGFEQLF